MKPAEARLFPALKEEVLEIVEVEEVCRHSHDHGRRIRRCLADRADVANGTVDVDPLQTQALAPRDADRQRALFAVGALLIQETEGFVALPGESAPLEHGVVGARVGGDAIEIIVRQSVACDRVQGVGTDQRHGLPDPDRDPGNQVAAGRAVFEVLLHGVVGHRAFRKQPDRQVDTEKRRQCHQQRGRQRQDLPPSPKRHQALLSVDQDLGDPQSGVSSGLYSNACRGLSPSLAASTPELRLGSPISVWPKSATPCRRRSQRASLRDGTTTASNPSR